MKIQIKLLKHCTPSTTPKLTRIRFNTLGRWSPNTSYNQTRKWFDQWKNDQIIH